MNSMGSLIDFEQFTRIKIKLAIMDWKGQGILSPRPDQALEELRELNENSDTPIALRSEAYYYMAKIFYSLTDYEFAYLSLRGAEMSEAARSPEFSEAFIFLDRLDMLDRLATQAHNAPQYPLLQCKISYLQGIMDCKGLGTPVDYKKARLKFETVVKLAPEDSLLNAQAHYRLGQMDFNGQGLEVGRNFTGTRDHLARSRPGLTERNQLRVDYTFALMDFLDDKPDYEKAYEGFKQVAEQRDIDPELASKAEKYLQEINSLRTN